MPDNTLRNTLNEGEFILSPGVFDLISAKIADRMNFAALYITGYGTVASYLGEPDAGIASYRDMLERITQIVKMTNTPVIADADTGYGGLLNVRETARGYEAAGVSAMQMEDQEFPKRCGHTLGRRVIPMKDMLRKIEVVRDSRKTDDFLLIARTDARTSLGMDEAIARGKAYRAAGADVVFIESPESEDEMRRVRDEIDGPLLANIVNGGRTPLISAEKLAQMGYQIAIHPALGFLAMGQALHNAYSDLMTKGLTSDNVPLYPFDEFHKLVGFEDIWEFENKYLD